MGRLLFAARPPAARGVAKTTRPGLGQLPWLAVVVGVSVAARVGAALYLGNTVAPLPGVADQLSYDRLAMRVLEGHGFTFAEGWWPATAAGQPTAHWSFAYVLLLAGVYGGAGHVPLVARLLQAALVGVLQPLLVHRIASRLFGPRAGLAAAAVIACYGYFVYYAGALMTESLCIVALLWGLAVALDIGRDADDRSRDVPLGSWAKLGLALSLAVLLRQAMLFVVPVVLGWCALRVFRARRPITGGRGALVRASAGVAVASLLISAAILPWTIRNWRAFDEFVLLNTNSGFAFFWGNHQIHGASFVPILPGEGTYGKLLPAEFAQLNEAQMEKALLRRGVSFVVEDPWRYARLSLSRVTEFVKFWPSEESGTFSNVVRVFSFGLLLPLILGGLWLAFRQGATADGPFPAVPALDGRWLLVAVAAVYSLLHLLTWTLVRYRLPVDAVLMPFAGLALAAMLGRLWRAPGAADVQHGS